MHRIVPELIVEKYRAGQYQGSFRTVGMFLDLSGFSSLTDALAKQGQHGAEILVGLMHNVFDPLVTSIFEHGGKIVGFAGDGVMALFPVETDSHSTALNALASAWWIQQNLSSRALEQTSYGSFSFSAKIGLALGDVSWGILPSRDLNNATYYFRGAAVEDSASAEHLARAGEIYLSQSIHDVLQADITADNGAAFHRLAGIRSELPGPSPIGLPPMDASVSRVFVPDNILLRDERGEFRQAVNLFMRFPELPDEKLQEFFQKLFELQEQYGGLLSHLDFGDKGCNMLMLWGAPVAYENDIGRALNFILDLKARADFPITAGVTYYVAHAGFLGGAMCECYTCYGWGVNLASRFMMSAPNGSIWIDERIARRIKNRFDFTYQGAQKFKGFDTEQKVFILHGRKAREEELHQGEFVGREVELSHLNNFLQPLWQGKSAGLLSIWGEAGIGKSRLVYELKFSPAPDNRELLWALCHSDQVLRHSFNPFRYWLSHYFGITSGMVDEERRQRFNQKLDELLASIPDPELVADLGRVRSALGALLDLYWPDSPYEKMDAEGRYNNTLLALTILFKAESLRQPVVIFIEDAQFLDEDSRAFLPRLKRALANHPVAILVSSRRTGSEYAFDESLADVSLELGALSRQAIANLAEIYLGGPASSELVHLLHERSEGNPYFSEQILVYLQDERLLEMGEEGWQAARTLQDASLPADIRSLLMARLDQLSAAVRDAIQTASVLGREFDVEVLAAMLGDSSALPGLLREAERVEILSPVNQKRQMFRHGLIRDAAYSMQMRARRQELHASVVDAVEKLYPGEIEQHYGELAYHAERALLLEKALHYLPLAGRQAAAAYQNAQAVDYFTRALALLPQDDLRTRFDLLLERVEVFHRIGDRKLELGDIDMLDSLAMKLSEGLLFSKAFLARSNYCITTGDYPSAMEYSERALALAGSEDRSMLDAYSYLASSLLRLGRLDDSMKTAFAGLNRAREIGARQNEAHMLNGLGLISIEQNDLPHAMRYLEQSIKLAREISDAVIEFSALSNLGNAAALLGDFFMARDCYERSYLGVHARGDRYGEGLMLSNLGWVAGMQGDFAASRNYQMQGLDIAREVGNPYQEAYTLINLSASTAIQGDAAGALGYALQGYELCRKIGERSGEGWALLNMGHAYMLAEELEQASQAYESCLEIREELRQSNLSAEALAGLLQISLYKDEVPFLVQRADAILAIMEKDKEFAGSEEPLRVYYTLYQALSKMKDPRSGIVLRNAIQLLDAQVSKFKDEHAQSMYVENVPWRRAIRQAGQTLSN
jgi:class 3 adenylate cyclase/Tfp pilus assembly protein PilF